MTERTIPEQRLILESLINERSLIIATIESVSGLIGSQWLSGYNTALQDQINNHKIAIQEYKKGLEKLKSK